MGNPLIRIGTRGSDLALWQANHVKRLLENMGCTVALHIIQTQGDRIQDLSFDKLEGKGFFTKEIEAELLQGNVDLAVHSHKDLETTPPPGLVIAAVSEREDPSELLLMRREAHDPVQKVQIRILQPRISVPKPLLLKISPDTEDRYLPDLVTITKEFKLS